MEGHGGRDASPAANRRLATGGGYRAPVTSRWADHAAPPRGADYDQRFQRLASSGVDVHGEAALVEHLLSAPLGDGAGRRAVLDAGCGTGRVAIELHRRGLDTVGVDLDAAMLRAAESKAPDLDWRLGDLASLDLGRRFDAVVLAGNVLIFVAPGAEEAVIERCAAHLIPGGLLIAGFQLFGGSFGPDRLDRVAARAGLELEHRWATWDRHPWSAGHGEPVHDYQVSVHALGGGPPSAPGTGVRVAYGEGPHADTGDAP